MENSMRVLFKILWANGYIELLITLVSLASVSHHKHCQKPAIPFAFLRLLKIILEIQTE